MSRKRTTLPGRSGPVVIERDGAGVPYITAVDRDDALFGLGFCHARDRGLQMLLVRILARGQGCQWLQADDEMLAIDRFFRRLDFGADSADELAALSPRARVAVDAYCRGANRYFERSGIPWELRILGVGFRGDPWTFADMNLTSKVIGYVALAISQADIERWIVESVQRGVSRELLEELFPGQLDGLDEDLIRQVRLVERLVPAELWGAPGIPRAMASNNWAVAGRKTASGLPIVCNDPHLQIDRLPAVWYEAVLRWGVGEGRHYAMGSTMPGTPGIVAGRNADLAWSVTYAYMDCVDSWVEDCRDGRYRRDEDWLPFRVREETIVRKGKPPVVLRFYENGHGTLEGDPHEAGYYLASRWSCGERTGAAAMDAMLGVLEARTVEEGRTRLAGLNNSSWCWVLGDREGAIGLQMSGRMPLRPPGTTGLVPLPGWDPENDWRGFAHFEDLPRALNPPEGFLVTANDDQNSLGRLHPSNLTLAPYRGERIRAVLAGRDRMDVEAMKALQFDLYSTQAARFMHFLRPLLPEFGSSPQARLLADWDLCYDADSRGAALFERFYRALLEEVLGTAGPGRWGRPVVTFLLDKTSLFADFYGVVDPVLLSEESLWFDGRSRTEVYRAALARALAAEPEPLSRSRQVVLRHLLFGGKLSRRLGFDRGPITLRGSRATVHQGQRLRNKGREAAFGPSYRFVADLADDAIHTTLPGGPSDRRFSRWYASGLHDWLVGKYKVLRGR